MIKSIYLQTWYILKKLPVKLWGITLLAEFLLLAVAILAGIPLIAIPIALALSAGLVGVLYKGYTSGGEADTKTLFKPFKDFKTFKRTAGGMGWMSLWIILWALIPVAGPFLAIWKGLQYMFVPYILNEEENVSGMDALKKSMSDTKGLKGSMFVALILPYIAFFLVSLVLSLLGLIPYVGIVFKIIMIIVDIAWYIAAPLALGLIQAGFYDIGKKPVRKAIPAPAPQITASQTSAPAEGDTPAASPAENITSAAAVKVCPSCGRENSADKLFCTRCGSKL